MGDVLGVMKTARPTKMLTEALIENDIDGVFAKNKKQLVEALDHEMLDIAIVDMAMPESEGYHLVEVIKGHSRYKALPIIGLVDALTDVNRCFEVGVTDILPHDSHEEALLAKIRAYTTIKRLQLNVNNNQETISKIQSDLDGLSHRIALVSVQDPLTNLYNRKFAMEQLEIAISRFDRAGVGFAIIICDMDNFKAVNSRYGQQVGDEVLMGVAQTLKYHSRVQDVVARWSSASFMMILPDTHLEGATIVAERARKRIENKQFVNKSENFSVTMTFGVAVYHQVMPLNMIISLADDALFQGKNTGKNQVVQAEF